MVWLQSVSVIRQYLQPSNYRTFNRIARVSSALKGNKNAYYQLLRKLHFWYPTIHVNDYRMRIDLHDEFVSKWLFFNGPWEPFESELMMCYLHSGMVFVDAGAHIGYYSLLAAKNVWPTGKVFSFEPSPDNYNLLLHNISLNKLSKVVTAEKLALSNLNTELDLYVSDHNTGDHRIYSNGNVDDDSIFFGAERRRIVQSTSVKLDDYLHARDLSQVDVIKIDVQGAEMAVLLGAANILLSSPHIVLFIEFWPHGLCSYGTPPAKVLHFLAEMGFLLFRINSQERNLCHINPLSFASQTEAADPREQIDLICCREVESSRLGRFLLPYENHL